MKQLVNPAPPRTRPLRSFAVSASVIVVIYLLSYFVLIQRVILRSPYSSGSETHTRLTPVPMFRWVSSGEAYWVLQIIFKPMIAIDQDVIRPHYWERSYSYETQP